MASWTQTGWKPGRRVWQRDLGATESCLYWESVFKGTTDTIVHIHLRANKHDDTQIHSCANVSRAWSSVKQRFPLLAAEVHEGHDMRFVVREENVVSLRKNDITFGAVPSFHAADQFITDILDGSIPLSAKLLACIYILRRTDLPHHFHVVLVVAHCITDGCSTSTILRTFFQTLASPYDPAPLPIPSRLQMCLSLESRLPFEGLSLPTQRWRKAIGYALLVVRYARFKGGHTIPANFTTATRSIPAKSRIQVFTLCRTTSNEILSNCRRHDVTMTWACYVLGQVVLSRLICRRYLEGGISEAEWQYRTREPMFFNCPLNLRPYLDQRWFQHGGSGEVGLNATISQHILPFMPLGAMHGKVDAQDLELVDGAPHFSELMSFERFLYRCGIARRRVEELFKHPRFVEICTSGYRLSLPQRHKTADAWRAAGERTIEDPELKQDASPIPVPSLGPILTQDGSSLGNMDAMIPHNYPLPARHPLSPLSQLDHPHRAGYTVQPVSDELVQECETPRLHVEYWRTHMRLRPAELYLGSWSVRGQLQFFMFYDEHVFSSEVVKEWLGEFKDAMMWYLGQSWHDGRKGGGTVPAAKL